MARVKSILRIKALHDQVQEQAEAASRIGMKRLEQRVAEQLDEIAEDEPPQTVSARRRSRSPWSAQAMIAC